LRGYVERTNEIEENLRKKDELLQRYEIELKKSQDDLLLNIDRVKEYQIKEEGWRRLEGELRDQNADSKSKLIAKKKKTKDYKYYFTVIVKKYIIIFKIYRDALNNKCKELADYQ
jgi:hypothetical protein